MGIVTASLINVYSICNTVMSKEDQEEEDDIQEEVMKNVVSSKGKFASFLQMRNSMVGSAPEEKQDPRTHHHAGPQGRHPAHWRRIRPECCAAWPI